MNVKTAIWTIFEPILALLRLCKKSFTDTLSTQDFIKMFFEACEISARI